MGTPFTARDGLNFNSDDSSTHDNTHSTLSPKNPPSHQYYPNLATLASTTAPSHSQDLQSAVSSGAPSSMGLDAPFEFNQQSSRRVSPSRSSSISSTQSIEVNINTSMGSSRHYGNSGQNSAGGMQILERSVGGRGVVGEGSAALKAREMISRLGIGMDEELDSGEESGWSSFDTPPRGGKPDRGMPAGRGAVEGSIFSPPYQTEAPNQLPRVPAPFSTQQYQLPTSASLNSLSTGGPSLSRISTSSSSSLLPVSLTMSRPLSYQGPASTAMDRIAPKSRSDIHVRHQSLTSACPPATSTESSPSKLMIGGTRDSYFGVSPVSASASPITSQRAGWKFLNQLAGAADTRDSTYSSTYRKPSISSPQYSSIKYYAEEFFNLPSSLLSIFLIRLNQTSPQPTLSGSTAPTFKAKRWPLLIRLIVILYLVFSFGFLGIKILDWSTPSLPFSSSTSRNKASDALSKALRLGPRGEAGMGAIDIGDAMGERAFVMGKAAGVGEWARGMTEGMRWSKEDGMESMVETQVEEKEPEWNQIKRIGDAARKAKVPETNPISKFKHPYRFAKMHDKAIPGQQDEIEPFVFKATLVPPSSEVTACMYSNEAWLPILPVFVKAWQGPVSLVFEVPHSRHSPQRAKVLESIAKLRASESLVKELVSFHIVGTPPSATKRTLSKIRERLITKPVAHNYHLNLARFFASTDVVFLVGDARIVPSNGLRSRLLGESIKDLVLERGDAVIVPTFGFVRETPGSRSSSSTMPSLNEMRSNLSLTSTIGPFDGVSRYEFEALARQNLRSIHDSLPIAPESWPQRKSALVASVNTRAGTPETPATSSMALYDRHWDLNHGPTNWYLWRKSSADPRLVEVPELGGGLGLGLDGLIGGGRDVYRVIDYDLHYAPNVVVSRKGQPWCTERFDVMKAACVYQMYLSGAEMWVLPDEWTFTVEVLEKRVDGASSNPSEKLKASISSRLYGKFHQEACMHYGREFLSMQMWDSDKAQHLRSICARTLSSWGMGLT